jgi:catalase
VPVVEPARLIEDIVGDFPGNRPETRPVHTHGISARGTFRASSVAPKYCRATHLSGAPVDVLVRYSNGSGLPVQRDAVPDARGMAVRFYLDAATGSPEPGDDPAARPHTDLIAMTLPTFFTPTVDLFEAFTRATVPRPRPQLSVWQRLMAQLQMHPAIPALPAGVTTSGDLGGLAFADEHPSACPAVLAMAGPIIGSFLGASYHAVHAFGLTAADGSRRYVRFFWEPEGGERDHVGSSEVYLFDDLRRRVATGRAGFALRAQVAEPGDDLADPTTPWPQTRRRLTLGRMELTSVPEDQVRDCEDLAFDPGRLTPGIEASDDPILAVRPAVYAASAQRRAAARAAQARAAVAGAGQTSAGP